MGAHLADAEIHQWASNLRVLDQVLRNVGGGQQALQNLCREQCVKTLALERWLLIIWLLHNLVEASFDLFRYLLLGDRLKPCEFHPLVA